MQEHPNDIGIVAAGANAAEMARRFLHPELTGLHGDPITKTTDWQRPTTEAERAAMAEGIEQAATRARLAAEAKASALEAIARVEKRLADAQAAVELFDCL